MRPIRAAHRRPPVRELPGSGRYAYRLSCSENWASGAMLRPGFELVSPADLRLPRCVDDAEQAIAIVREHQLRWRAA